jgi:hypothetical protein
MSDYPQCGLHPDADSLSAFVEGVLPEHERVACLAHIAECAVCREVVFLAQEPLPVPAADRLVWWKRWLAPVPALSFAAVAGVLVLSVAIYRVERPLPKPTAEVVAKSAPVVAVAPVIPQTAAPRQPPMAVRKPAPAPPVLKAAPSALVQEETASESFVVNGSLSAGVKAATKQVDVQPNQVARADSVPATGSAATPTVNTQSVARLSPVPLAGRMMASRAPLPNRPAAVTSATSGKIMLAADSVGALYRSDDGGKKWELISPVWTGKVVDLAAGTDGAFRLTADDGASWSSRDGVHWSLAK